MSTKNADGFENRVLKVLILILMEYALWVINGKELGEFEAVLILILMEYALWEVLKKS